MFRIDHPAAASQLSIPSLPQNPGYFDTDDSAHGEVSTPITAEWLNTVQEELVNVVKMAGLPLQKDQPGQLFEAIQLLIANAIAQTTPFMTGDIRLTYNSTPSPGWILMDDGTIGNVESAATTRASADCEALFHMLWTSLPNSLAPIVGGRGATASADWAAGKALSLPRIAGRALAAAGAGQTLSVRQLGQFVGEETHTQTIAEMPAHSHKFGVNGADNWNYALSPTMTNPATVDISTKTTGGGQPFNIMQPTSFLYSLIKL